MADAPFFVVEKGQVEVVHAHIVAPVEEIVRSNDGVAHANAGQNRQVNAVKVSAQH